MGGGGGGGGQKHKIIDNDTNNTSPTHSGLWVDIGKNEL